MNCIETRKNIEALPDGELDDELQDAVEHHLWICPACLQSKEQMRSVSNFVQMSQIVPPPVELDKRIMKSFQNHHAASPAWRRAIFGGFVIAKPIFAALLITAATGFWLAFQVGKNYSTTVSIASPSINSSEIPLLMPAEKKVQTVTVEVFVIKEKTVTRTIYVRERKNNKKETSLAAPKKDILPSSSSVAGGGYFTDVSLKGFEPTAEMNAKIIKREKDKNEEKKDEK